MRRLLRGAPILGALAFTACAPSIAGPREVVVTIEHSKFRPDVIEVDAGSTVRFVIVNEDPIDHEFIVGDASVQLRHENGTERHHGRKPGEITVPAGTKRSTSYTVVEPGTLIFGCHLPGHYAYGMRGELRAF